MNFALIHKALVIFLFFTTPSFATLKWESRSIELKAKPSQSSAMVEFLCRNTGKKSVEINKVKTACGCTSATVSKKIIAPGERGVIKGTFMFGTREGMQRKRFEVITSDGKRNVLFLSVDIPRTYRVTPRRLSWSSDAHSSQPCQLVNASKTPIRIISAKSSSPAFGVKIKEIRFGFEYEVLVTPLKSSGAARAIIQIYTESFSGQKPKVYTIYAVAK